MDPGDGTSPHHRFSQRGFKSGKTASENTQISTTSYKNNVSKNDDNDDKSTYTLNDTFATNLRFGRAYPTTYRTLYTASSLQEYLRYQDNEEWESVQSAIISLFRKKSLAVRELTNLRESVKELWTTCRVGPLLFDYYLKQAISRGVAEIRDRLTYLTDIDLIQATEESWVHFYSETLTTLQAIFFPMKPKNESLRHFILICFRDGVVLKINLREALDSVATASPPPGIQHMLLILQSIHDSYPPNENYLALERLVAMVVSPYMGYRGIYEGNTEPALRSKEPDIFRWSNKRYRSTLKKSSNLNPHRTMGTLEEMFLSVYSKDNDSEE